MKLLILDGNSVINRAYYGVKLLTTREGLFTNAIYGFLNILERMEKEEQPEAVCVAFDLHGPTFRHLQFEGYKATRHGMPEELAQQMPLMKQVLKDVAALWPDGVRYMSVDEAQMSYRRTIFSESDGVVLGATVRLEKGDPVAIRERMDDLMARRKATQPLEYPSAGSTFKRPEGNFAGTLIEKTGLKGLTVGGAQVSEKHAGFLINVDGATCADVLALIEEVQKRVFDASGIHLEPEVKIVR